MILDKAIYKQGSVAWLTFRKSHIGGSDIAAVVGVNPWKTTYEVWAEKTGKASEVFINDAMRRGTRLEPLARDKYMSLSDKIMMPDVVVYKHWDVAMASLDGITPEGDFILEIKCPMSEKRVYEAKGGYIPKYYMVQIQWQLMCSGVKAADYFVYYDDETYARMMVREDVEMQKDLLKKAKKFWKFVEEDIPPPKKNKEIPRIYDKDANVFAQQWKEAYLQVEVLKQDLQKAEEVKKKIEDELKVFSNGSNASFAEAGVNVKFVKRPGNVDWKKFLESKKIEESEKELFRKSDIVYASFSLT